MDDHQWAPAADLRTVITPQEFHCLVFWFFFLIEIASWRKTRFWSAVLTEIDCTEFSVCLTFTSCDSIYLPRHHPISGYRLHARCSLLSSLSCFLLAVFSFFSVLPFFRSRLFFGRVLSPLLAVNDPTPGSPSVILSSQRLLSPVSLMIPITFKSHLGVHVCVICSFVKATSRHDPNLIHMLTLSQEPERLIEQWCLWGRDRLTGGWTRQ